MIEPISLLAETDLDAFSTAVDVNFKGVFYGMRAVLPHMTARGSGTIITVSSGAAHGPMQGWPTYCSTKAGAYMLTRAADLENRDKGIRVLGLSPGTVATQMQRDIKASGVNRVSELDWSDHIPPEWPAKALVWMCSDAADPHLGTDVSLREDNIRREVGLI
jgi:NAD(P)-dependent dehydrogenase (short-subunit alcohol dehydrogenase family)